MSRLKGLTIAGVLAAQVTTAMAADMPGTYAPLPIPERLQPRTFETNSGWYLRGDLGYDWGQTNDPQSQSGYPSAKTSALGNSPSGGFGFGIKRNWMRTDVTIDYAAAKDYKGTIATPDDVTAKTSAWSVLFNGYLDLGSWYRVSPYIGAGVGAARVRVFDYASSVAPPFAGGTSNTQWNFAWAAMAGVGVTLSSNLMMDAGYRYINYGDASSAADSFGSMKFKNLAAHEVRVGLRWSFDDYH